MLDKLKRTVAVTCLLATACFVILWMRSLKQWDSVIYADTSIGMLGVDSSDGMLTLSHAHSEEYRWKTCSIHFMITDRDSINTGRVALFRWPRFRSDLDTNSLSIPIWLLIAVSGSVGMALGVSRPLRFSLRTLAIATTLIVLTLGLGVAASRLTLG